MKTQMSLDMKIQEMAARIRELREIEGLSQERMAESTGVSLEEYRSCEAGQSDLNFAFIYRCAQIFGVDVTDIVEGASPRLANYTLTRAGVDIVEVGFLRNVEGYDLTIYLDNSKCN